MDLGQCFVPWDIQAQTRNGEHLQLVRPRTIVLQGCLLGTGLIPFKSPIPAIEIKLENSRSDGNPKELELVPEERRAWC